MVNKLIINFIKNINNNLKKGDDMLFSDWELRLVLILIVMVVMLTVVDLGLSFDELLNFII